MHMLGFVVSPHYSSAACGALDRDRAMPIAKNMFDKSASSRAIYPAVPGNTKSGNV